MSPAVKYLGVAIDKNLNFTDHVRNTVKKATMVGGSLYPVLNKKIPARTRLNIYKLYTGPILTHMVMVVPLGLHRSSTVLGEKSRPSKTRYCQNHHRPPGTGQELCVLLHTAAFTPKTLT